MKRAICALILLAALTLSACAVFMEGTRIDVRPHEPPAPPNRLADGDILVTSEDELALILLDAVGEHMSRVSFHVPHPNINEALELTGNAIDLAARFPLVSYATQSITPQVLASRANMVEMDIVITYRKSAEEVLRVRSIHNATGATNLLGQAMRTGAEYLTMLTPAHIASVSFFRSSLANYYNSYPLDIIVQPDMQIALHPSTGFASQRIVEITLYFGFSPDQLSTMQETLYVAAQAFIAEIPQNLSDSEQATWLIHALSAHVTLTPDDADDILAHTAYGALVTGHASSYGTTRAFSGLLSLLPFDADTIADALMEAEYHWGLPA